MPSSKSMIHIPLSRLVVILAVAVVPICAVGLYSMVHSERALNRTAGIHFKTIAESTAAEISQFINDRVVAVGALAVDPLVVEAVTEANKAYSGMSGPEIEAKIQKIEKGWNTPASEPMVKQMLESRVSKLLTRYRNHDRRFLRITLTDRHGGTIAATHKTLDYFQADEDFWQKTYAQGRGAVHLTDVLYDGVTNSNYIGLGVPVMVEGTNTFIGVLDALVEVSTIFPIIHRVVIGPTARVILVKSDGTVIHSPSSTLSMKVKSEEFGAAEENLANLTDRARGYSVITMRNGETVLAGYADTGLSRSFPNLGWYVLVAQDAREAFAATRGVMRLIFISAYIGLAMVTLMVVYFMLHRRQEYMDLKAATEVRAEAAESLKAPKE